MSVKIFSSVALRVAHHDQLRFHLRGYCHSLILLTYPGVVTCKCNYLALRDQPTPFLASPLPPIPTPTNAPYALSPPYPPPSPWLIQCPIDSMSCVASYTSITRILTFLAL